MQKSKDKQQESISPNSDSEEEEEEDEDQVNAQMDSFLIDDDEDIEYDADEEERRKKKRQKKRGDKPRKRKRQEDVDKELEEDDLYLLEENQRGRGFTKLKKKHPKPEVVEKKERHYDEEEDDLVQSQEQVQYPEEQQRSEELSDVNQHYEKQNNIEDIFEPGYDDFLLKNQDQMTIDHDVPERLLIKYRDRKEETDVRQSLREESQWIYEKIRDRISQKKSEHKVKETIYRVLEILVIEYCQIMYIYYYKRFIWQNELTLELLWRIYQLDDEWAIIKNMKRHLSEVAFQQLESFNAQVHPNVHKLLEDTNDIKTLRYIKEYADFQLLKKGQVTKKEGKRSTNTKTIIEICQHSDLMNFMEKDRVWLTPAQLFENIKDKVQKYKPKSPVLNPKEEIESYVKNRPYLTETEIFFSIALYLKNELFNYPDLRRWMKEKYSKRAVITTTPTKKGEQDIGLYSMYYPVKRIKKKPVSSFKNDIWLLVLEAQKANLIKVDIMFEWELTPNSRSIENDPIYKDIITLYFDHSQPSTITDFWNLLRKQILQGFINDCFIPFLHKEIKQDLARDAEKEVLTGCGNKFKSELNKGTPVKRDGKSIVVMGMVLQGQKLGLAIVDEDGNLKFKGTLRIPFSSNLKTVVADKSITEPIDEFKPDLIIVAANCRQAITLRKDLRESKQQLRPDSLQFCALGDYQICSKISKYQMLKTGTNEERAVLEAIALCRLKQNSMAEILNLWSEKIDDNGCLMLNLHPLQKIINKYKLKAELERVAVEMVNLVGIDLRKLKENLHLQKQLQFVCGLGYKKSIYFLEKLKIFDDKELKRRLQLQTENIVGKVVYKNCSAFFKINTPAHQELLQNGKHEKRQDKQNSITLLDLTRIHDESYYLVQDVVAVACADLVKKKTDYDQQYIAEVMRNPARLKTVQIEKDAVLDMEFVTQEFNHPFKDPREPEKSIDNKDAFFSILRQSPETLKKYMVFSCQIVNLNEQFLNVKIIDNGLFGSIRLPNDNKIKYTKDSTIKAIITRFPFDPDEKKKNYTGDGREEQELLKVEMSLSFPHNTSKPNHDCIKDCCYQRIIQRDIHPKIDLEHFTIKKEDIPVLEVREEVRNRTELRLFNHPKFKNMGFTQAVQWISSEPIGQFIVRPSATKKDYLTITWKFYEGVICHINLKAEAKALNSHSYCFKIEQSGPERSYNSLDDMIEFYIKPMNRLMQDVISNRKFLPLKPDDVEEKLKQERQKDPSIIHYFFGCSVEYPKFIILYYMPKESKIIKQLIRVKDKGLLFHDQNFDNLKELTTWFKSNFMSKDYQKYIPKTGTIRLR